MMSETLSQLAQPALIAVASTVALVLVRGIPFRIAARWAGRTEPRIDDVYLLQSQLPIPSTGLAYGILKGTILVVGFLIVLNFLGISIAPLLTALGVGGLAVALALQDTLSNPFAGRTVHIREVKR